MRISFTADKLFHISMVAITIALLIAFSIIPIRVSEDYLPTIINGISTVTGIIIGLTSGLVAFSMSQDKGLYLRRHEAAIVVTVFLLFVPIATLIGAYTSLMDSQFYAAARLAIAAFEIASSLFLICFEFFASRTIRDLRTPSPA